MIKQIFGPKLVLDEETLLVKKYIRIKKWGPKIFISNEILGLEKFRYEKNDMISGIYIEKLIIRLYTFFKPLIISKMKFEFELCLRYA